MTPRRNDPWTSYAARLGIPDVHASQAAVLALFTTQPTPRTLEVIVEAVNLLAVTEQLPRFSDSRIRTAVKELMEDGLLYDTGYTARTVRGNPARLIGLRAPRPAVPDQVQP